MDTDTLVDDLIEDGQKLVEMLPQHGFELAGAFWLKASEDGKWCFYIVSPIVDAEGAVKGYRRLHPLVRGMAEPFYIDPLEIRLIGPSHPIARDVMAIQARFAGPRVCPVRFGGKILGNVSIDEAYFYALSAATT